ncbi:sigma-70 family RNA polymerase sigma factor [Jiangella aurantiaca]|uniref:RNA polymerase sigma factor n=1 Tax=Jiangella aurantiaca TaxID=2530373 RepID=A0A4R5AI90_9ACTN|nr:RNA polymerase subunit sigma-70 [Jiangella aurantiaca]TDD72363.1 sigma-70 family RNA polymerase sigma factor [Jiangella aurantiaca]
MPRVTTAPARTHRSRQNGPVDDFTAAIHRHRRELHVHCYRMLGSFDDAEEVVQEALLRAWTRRDSFEPGSNLRAWLYRIATNACLDLLRQRSRRPEQVRSFAEVPWLQPYPDRLLDQVAPSADEPEAVVVGRETIELAFVAAMQALPAQQRAVLVMRDAIGWSAAETAAILETTVPAVNSALQRARATLHRSPRSPEASPPRTVLSAEERDLLDRYVALSEHPDVERMAALVRDDIRVTMPPQPVCYDGLAALAPLQELAFGPDGLGDWRLLPTTANRLPATACYLRPRAEPDDPFTAFKLDVLRVEDGLIAEITTFGPELFQAFGLPAQLP